MIKESHGVARIARTYQLIASSLCTCSSRFSGGVLETWCMIDHTKLCCYIWTNTTQVFDPKQEQCSYTLFWLKVGCQKNYCGNYMEHRPDK
jgi:hypothetical protein